MKMVLTTREKHYEQRAPPFAAHANLCGGKGIRVTRAEKATGTLEMVLKYDGPSLVEIMTDADLI
jgi:thiamine pyrophosphate-dependent acetolactate synthase large subunit-like protein